MPSVSFGQVHLNTFGDVVVDEVINFNPNVGATGKVDIYPLQPGPNSLNPPYGLLGYAITGVLIKFPADNTVNVMLKGNAADVGIALHQTNPTFIGLDPSHTQQNCVLHNPSASAVTVVLFWI